MFIFLKWSCPYTECQILVPREPTLDYGMVWCGILSDTIVVPYFFEDHVNPHTFGELLDTVVTDFLDGLPLDARQKIWFQLDEATAYYARRLAKKYAICFVIIGLDEVALSIGLHVHLTLHRSIFFSGAT